MNDLRKPRWTLGPDLDVAQWNIYGMTAVLMNVNRSVRLYSLTENRNGIPNPQRTLIFSRPHDHPSPIRAMRTAIAAPEQAQARLAMLLFVKLEAHLHKDYRKLVDTFEVSHKTHGHVLDYNHSMLAQMIVSLLRAELPTSNDWDELDQAADHIIIAIQEMSTIKGIRTQPNTFDPYASKPDVDSLYLRLASHIYPIVTAANPFERTIGDLRIGAFPLTAEHLRRQMIMNGLLTQDEIDLLTCHESYDPFETDEHVRTIQRAMAAHRMATDRLSVNAQHHVNDLLRRTSDATPPRYSGELALPDDPDLSPLKTVQSLRLVLTGNGIWLSLVLSVQHCAYVAFFWSPKEPMQIPVVISDAFTRCLLVMLPAIWHDACERETRSLRTEQRAAQQYGRSSSIRRRRIKYIPVVKWSSNQEMERIRERAERLKTPHHVVGHIRNLRNHDYVPADEIIQKAVEDAADPTRVQLPGIGQTWVGSHRRGIGPIPVPEAHDLIVSRGLFYGLSILQRENDAWSAGDSE